MLLYPYRNEFFIEIETYDTDRARADQLIEAFRAKWALLREARNADDLVRSSPLPAASPVLTT